MKQTLLIILFAVVTLNSCAPKMTPSTSAKVELPPDFDIAYQVDEFLDNWHQAAAEANFDDFFNALADEAIYIGTDKTEVWSKEEFINYAKPYFDRGIAWEFKSVDRNLYIGENKEYFWFDEILSTWMATSRASGVIHFNKETNTYEIVHYVLSLPIPNDSMNDVIKLIQTKERQKSK